MPQFTALDQFNFHHSLAESTGTALALFTAEGCGSCRLLKQVIEAADNLDDVTCFTLDAGTDKGIVDEFEIFHLPGLLLYRDGEFHAVISAEPTPAAVRRAIDEALATAAQELP